MQSYIGHLLYMIFYQSEFSNVFSNYLSEPMQSHIGCICMIFCRSEFLNVCFQTSCPNKPSTFSILQPFQKQLFPHPTFVTFSFHTNQISNTTFFSSNLVISNKLEIPTNIFSNNFVKSFVPAEKCTKPRH